jgi:hypothetical protein
MAGEVGHFPVINELLIFLANQFKSSSIMKHEIYNFTKSITWVGTNESSIIMHIRFY